MLEKVVLTVGRLGCVSSGVGGGREEIIELNMHDFVGLPCLALPAMATLRGHRCYLNTVEVCSDCSSLCLRARTMLSSAH